MCSLDIEQVTREHFPRIRRAALVLSGNAWDADDLAQETFLVFARTWTRFEGRSSVFTWLYGILLNLDRRERRRQGTRRRRLQHIWDTKPRGPRTTPAAHARLEAREWKSSLWAYVARLPDGQREALVLRFSEELSYDEVAEVLDCPLGTVKSRIYYGLMGLRRELEAAGEDTQMVPAHPGEDIEHET